MGLGREEIVWIREQLQKVVELKEFLGFIRKYRGKTKTHVLEICFNKNGRFIKIMEFATNQKYSLLVVPEGEGGGGWKALEEALISVLSFSISKKKEAFQAPQSKVEYSSGSHTFAEVATEGGPRRGALMPVGKMGESCNL